MKKSLLAGAIVASASLDSLSECFPVNDKLGAILNRFNQGETIRMPICAFVISLVKNDVVVGVSDAEFFTLFGDMRQEVSVRFGPQA